MEKTPASNPELEQAILADPEDPTAYLTYADWLWAQGDPRSGLIAKQYAAASAPTNPRLAAEAARHLETHQEALLGLLAAWQLTQDGRDEPAFEWRNGFIHTARLSVDEHGETTFKGQLDELYDLLVGHPSARFLVDLRIGMNRTSYDHDQQPIIDAMIRTPPAALRRLHIGDFAAPDECEMSWYNVGNLDGLWKVVPGLRQLIVQGGSWKLGDLHLPEVQHVELRTGGLSAESGDAIGRARIPKVEHLEIWYGTKEYGGGCGTAQVSALLARTDLPALRWLGLKNADFGDELCAVLAQGPLLRQLTHLDLSMSVLTDDGARTIAANQGAFAHLHELIVSETYVTPAGLKLLAGCAKTIVAEDMRDDEDPDYRYVSVGE